MLPILTSHANSIINGFKRGNTEDIKKEAEVKIKFRILRIN